MSNVTDGIGEILSSFECSKCNWPVALFVKSGEQYLVDPGYGKRELISESQSFERRCSKASGV